MTNGEKIKVVFTDIQMWGESKDTLDYSLGGMIHRVTKSWWNAEYKEPTTKNDLGVLDKIKTEIKGKIIKRPWLDFEDRERDRNDAFLEVLDIFDKYSTESEE